MITVTLTKNEAKALATAAWLYASPDEAESFPQVDLLSLLLANEKLTLAIETAE